MLTVGAETRRLKEWAKRTGIAFRTIGARLRRGWTPEQAVDAAPRPTTRPGPKTRHSFASDYQSRKMKERRQHARALRICLECLADKAAPARTKCPVCLLADSIRHQKAA